jgi:hypothetical protein
MTMRYNIIFNPSLGNVYTKDPKDNFNLITSVQKLYNSNKKWIEDSITETIENANYNITPDTKIYVSTTEFHNKGFIQGLTFKVLSINIDSPTLDLKL